MQISMTSVAAQPLLLEQVSEQRRSLVSQLAFALLCLVNVALFIRPSDIIPGWEKAPVYLLLLLAAVFVGLRFILPQLRRRSLVENPATLCVVGLVGAVVLSHASHLAVAPAAKLGIGFAKILAYYLLLVGVVNTPGRMRGFLLWLLLCVLVLCMLPLLQYHDWIDNPALRALADRGDDPLTGKQIIIIRLRGAGIFNDPNDLCQMADVGFFLALFAVFTGRRLLVKALGAAAAGVFCYTIILTQSRGGFLALLAGMMALLVGRFGLRRMALLSLLILPVMFVVFGGRQTELSTAEQTGQERIQIWSDAMMAFRHNPLFGLGAGKFESDGLVAHNAFLNTYADLGFVGGTLFVGAFFLAGLSLLQLRPGKTRIIHPELRGMYPFLFGAVVAYIVGMLSLSRQYEVPTYMVLGMVTAYRAMVPTQQWTEPPRMSRRLVWLLIGVSLAFLLSVHVFTRLFVNW